MRRMLVLIAIVLVAVTGVSHAVTYKVNWNGTGDYETISEGIAAAETGDAVPSWGRLKALYR